MNWLARCGLVYKIHNATPKLPLFYWSSEGRAEIYFILQFKNEIIPIEVKSGYNKKAKSLNVYMNTLKPIHAIKSLIKNYARHENLCSIPLYMISSFAKIIGQSN
jgi:predicted AAA+ superfamily ATPase